MYEEQVLLNRFSPENPCAPVDRTEESNALPPPPWTRYNEGARLRCQSCQSQQKLYRNKKNSGSCLRGPKLEFFVNIQNY
jgi:hypothetical protein